MSIFDDENVENCSINDDNDGEILSEDENVEVIENVNDDNKDIHQKIEPKKRSVRNPRPKLNIDILTGDRGIHTIENYFKDIKYHGKGHEKHDLDEILKRLQHWAHRMYPAYKFDDVLSNIERLSKKKQLQHYMYKYRLDLLDTEKQKNSFKENDDNKQLSDQEDEPFDEFDALINEQIAISKLPPITPGTMDKTDTTAFSSVVDTPKFVRNHGGTSTPHRRDSIESGIIPIQQTNLQLESEPVNQRQCDKFANPVPSTSSYEPDVESLKTRTSLTSEQLAKIEENRRIAQERLKAKKLAINTQ